MSVPPSTSTVRTTVDHVVQHKIEQFLYYEASLLDSWRLEDWLGLLAEDLHYFMPIRSDRSARDHEKALTGPDAIAIFDDNKSSMTMRVKKLASGAAWAEEPRSRIRHLISNVQAFEGERPGCFTVVSAFIVYRNRSGRQVDIFAGERRDELRELGQTKRLEISKRTVLVDQTTLLSSNISFFF